MRQMSGKVIPNRLIVCQYGGPLFWLAEEDLAVAGVGA